MAPIAPDLEAYCKSKLGDRFQEFRIIAKPYSFYYELQILTTDNSFASETVDTNELATVDENSIDALIIKKIDSMVEELLK